MSEDFTKIIETLCQQSYNKVYDVYEVFKDFFDEERVDLVGVDYTEIARRLRERKYSDFTTKASIITNPIFTAYSEHEQSIIKAILAEDALSTFIGSDITVFKYLFPFISANIGRVVNGAEAQILVHFPEVRVTNEYDKFVDIKELYARVKVSNNGTIVGTFGLLRADYPLSHIYADYAHSHIPGITLDEGGFKSPCLGNGPINSTISSLVRECDLNFWMLFCRELDTYVTVESLTGGPYRKMENITGTRKLRPIPDNISNSNLNKTLGYFYNPEFQLEMRDFIKHILKTDAIKFGFSNNSYILAMGFKDFIISMSNCFIDYVNNHMDRTDYNREIFTVANMDRKGLLHPYVIKDGKIYSYTKAQHSSGSYLSYTGKKVLTFKGKDVKLNVYDDTENTEDNVVYLLDFKLCESILFKMITYLNIIYGSGYYTTEVRSCKKRIIL